MRITDNLRRLGLAIILSWGWKRAAIALVAGALSALAMAPFNAWPILFVTFPVLVWLVDGSAAGRWSGAMAAAVAGWCFAERPKSRYARNVATKLRRGASS